MNVSTIIVISKYKKLILTDICYEAEKNHWPLLILNLTIPIELKTSIPVISIESDLLSQHLSKYIFNSADIIFSKEIHNYNLVIHLRALPL